MATDDVTEQAPAAKPVEFDAERVGRQRELWIAADVEALLRDGDALYLCDLAARVPELEACIRRCVTATNRPCADPPDVLYAGIARADRHVHDTIADLEHKTGVLERERDEAAKLWRQAEGEGHWSLEARARTAKRLRTYYRRCRALLEPDLAIVNQQLARSYARERSRAATIRKLQADLAALRNDAAETCRAGFLFGREREDVRRQADVVVGGQWATDGPRGLAAIVGQWPGDESDEEVKAALEDL